MLHKRATVGLRSNFAAFALERERLPDVDFAPDALIPFIIA